MSDKILQFPGVKVEEEYPVQEVIKLLQEKDIKSLVVVAILEGDQIMVIGNTGVSTGVYLMETGKNIIMNTDS